MQAAQVGTMLTPGQVTFASLDVGCRDRHHHRRVARRRNGELGLVSRRWADVASDSLGVDSARDRQARQSQARESSLTCGGTPVAPSTYPAMATLSDDGKTLTFETTVTGFVLEYAPRAAQDLTTALGS